MATQKKKIHVVTATVLITAAVLIVMAVRNTGKMDVEGVREETAVPVEVETAGTLEMPETVEAIGNVEPARAVIIYSEATGILERLTVDEGDFVEAGQHLATIESSQRQLAVRQVESEMKSREYHLENMRRDYERYKRLADEGVVSVKRFEDAQTLYNAALHGMESLNAQIENAKRRLKETRIFAPITGVVAERFIDEGELVTESTMSKTSPIAAIADISRVKVKVPVGEGDIKKVRKGQSALVKTDFYRNRKFHGRVENISPVTDFATRTTTVEVVVDNPGYLLRQGMFARVTIDAGSRNVLAVSLDALMRMPGSGSYYCFRVLDGNTVEKTYISTGVIRDGMVEVTGGLREGDAVAVTSQGVLETGRRVIPVPSVTSMQKEGGRDK